jgi:beta-mannanase
MAEYRRLEGALGRKLDVAHYYYNWGAYFPTWRERWHSRNGRIPMISWDAYSTAAIANGSQDRVIRARATGIRNFSKPVFIRWFWEPDASDESHLIASPASYIAAWRRIVHIFRSQGATNASFVWCPTAWGFASGEAQRFYPGDRYVDWVCSDPYNWAPGRSGAEWRSLASAIRPFYRWGERTHKPMMLGEWGSQERGAGEKAHWLRRAAFVLKHRFPKIRAVFYFDSHTKYNWKIDTSRSSFRAFKDISRRAFFNP